ncbi:YihY/virulence factor BrkB family protein [Kitasatospora sp. NBC_01287]|uniref:YhjD/YihY/BrkB family envelope integrity protein n=1 Tax=Kitasatospora sp. NBC_01287 TaxID=2903573 RepID=UPI0022548D15|nr:YhjD/YihY/BrkB family envelope integrity protein [Kitasatospora sp. NBC_01287]MCX4751663.1 YihY/virulence factor BrkB family protein [Kitasatospora sp. NBC_01287]
MPRARPLNGTRTAVLDRAALAAGAAVTAGRALLAALPGAGQALRAAAAELWQRGREVELLQRSMAFAALFFVTLVPLLVVIAAASPAGGDGITGWITDGLGLSSRGTEAVSALFASQHEVLSTTTGFSLAALAFFGLSLIASMQTAYERIWQLPRGPWHTAWRQAVGLAGVIGYVVIAAWSGEPFSGSAAQPTLRIAATVLGGALLFWWLQRLLLSARVPWRTLLPGALATMAALAGLRFFSRLVFAPLLVSNAVSYGTVGTVLVVQSWLIGVGFTVYGGALAGRALHARSAPPERPERPERTDVAG